MEDKVTIPKECFYACVYFALLAIAVPVWSQTAGTSTTTMVVGSSGSCINVDDSSSQASFGIDQWACTGGSNQNFIFTPTSDGYYTIQPQHDSLCLDAGSGSVTSGLQVVQNTCSTGTSQKWRAAANSDGSYAIGTFNGAGCLDVYGGRTANGAILTTYACHGSSNESFTMAGFRATSSSKSGSTLSGFVSAMIIQSSGSCVDVSGGSNLAGFGIDQSACTGTNNQIFAFTPTSDGYYNIQPQNDSLCIDAGSASITTGLPVVQNACSGALNQKWRLVANSDGSYAVVTPDGTGCLDVYAGRTANGTIVTTYACHGSSNENFLISRSSLGASQTPAPAISPAAGTYAAPLSVTITQGVSGSTVYYTTDGSTPTAASKAYSGSITLTASATVRAIAIVGGAPASSAVSAAFAVTTATPPATAPGVSTTTMVVQSTGSCINVDNSSSLAGLGIDEWTCTGASNQWFVFTLKSDGSYIIQPQNDGLCLDAGSGSVTTAVQVVQNACTNSSSQKWRVLANIDGSYAVGTFSGGGCLDVYAGRAANGTILTTYACHVAGNESFLLAGFSPASPTQPMPSAPTNSSAVPVLINYSPSAHAGDVIYVQGANFDTTSQVRLGNGAVSPGTQLTVINRVGSSWLAAQIPPSWFGAMFLSVSNSSGNSSVVKLNGAIPFHLDALQLVPGGAFRVLGRNLTMPGYTPLVTIDGHSAVINVNASTENMLIATAPATLSPTSNSVILVDNGNGTGAARLDRVIAVVAGSGDPFGLGVGWGAGFTFATRVTAVNTPCNGSQDDSGKIQVAINAAAVAGGVVQLPAGKCVLANSLTMRSKVVLQGAGKDVTILQYRSNYPISSQGSDLVGLRNLTLTNANSTLEGLIWQQNTRSFFQNVKIAELASRQLFLTGNRNFVVSQTDFVQTASVGAQNPYLFSECSGFLFIANTSVAVDGSPTFISVHDALILNSHFSRNSVNQNEAVVIATHQFVMDFAYRMSIIGNTFDVLNGPITNTNRNDGETILTEGGGGNRTENLGAVVSATANTLTDPGNTINVNPFGNGLPENYGVAIVSGTGAGQTREVVNYTGSTLQVDHAWDVIPDTTSHYATFVWGLEKTLIEGNTLAGNPRGIWLYQTAVRDVDVSNNTIVNGGGIFLRTYQSETVKQFDPMYNVRITNNKVNNSDQVWMSYTNIVFVNKDTSNFGTADTGIELRSNNLVANNPNVTSVTEDYAGTEGFMNLMRSETSGGQLTGTPMVLGTILQSNQCLNCNIAFVIGTGDYGTVLMGNAPLPGSPKFLNDWQTLGAGIGGSIGTVVR